MTSNAPKGIPDGLQNDGFPATVNLQSRFAAADKPYFSGSSRGLLLKYAGHAHPDLLPPKPEEKPADLKAAEKPPEKPAEAKAEKPPEKKAA